MQKIKEKIEYFVNSTRDVIYLREIDRILIIRPNKIQHVNDSAFDMLYSLYHTKQTLSEMLIKLERKYSISQEQLTTDLLALLDSIECIMRDDYSRARRIEQVPYEPDSIAYPVISEIALTYRCQNRCDFCYASSPFRGDPSLEMTTGEARIIIEKINREAHVPTVSFTGGEPTMRDDLPELVAYADSVGMRTNLITNGIRCADKNFVDSLASAGLKSAQVSLESHDEDIHDSIVGNPGAYQKTIRAIENLKAAGIYTHTNSTICHKNKNSLIPFVQFIKDTFGFPYLSMNMIIKTGIARDNANVSISYSSIGSIIKPVIDFCETIDMKFVWYSPTPYCLFNPVDHNLGSKSCACISGLLSVSPSGELLPCSSYDRGVGNLLKNSFEYIWKSDEALYWRERRYIPPVCGSCEYEILCSGACPLYWEQAGNFKEIEDVCARRPAVRNLFWNIEKSLRVRTKGIPGIKKFGGR